VTELNIIGALLDPFQRKMTVVQDFFVTKDTTAFHLLSQAMDTHTGVQQLQANNNLSGMNEAATTCEFAHAVSSSMVNGKHDLLSKHVHFTGTGDKEIQLSRYLSIAHDDVLAWWK